MTKTTQPTDVAGTFGLVAKRALILIGVVALCAVIPLLIKNYRVAPEDSSEPSTIFEQVEPSTPEQTEDQGPTEDSVRELSEAVADAAGQGYDVPVSANVGKVKTVPGPYVKLGRIKIPSVGLDAQYGEGVYEKTLNRGPGHWPGTPMPGSEGNAVLSGHRNTHTQPFKQLDELKDDDKIIVSYGDKTTTYRVSKTTIVPEDEFKDLVVRQPKGDGAREITLFACHPEGNPIFRIVVQAKADPK